MDVKVGSSFSWVCTSLFPPYRPRISCQTTLSKGPYVRLECSIQEVGSSQVNSFRFIDSLLQSKQEFSRRHVSVCSTTKDQSLDSDLNPDVLDGESHVLEAEILSPTVSLSDDLPGSDGKPGFVSFYNSLYKSENETNKTVVPPRSQSSLLWFLGPAILVASFVFPSLYLRRILSIIFEDSLLTDFLILFFTEALFYSGVAVFLLLIDRLRRPIIPEFVATDRDILGPPLGQRISSVATLALSLTIPMVTMGLVWPWTGPAASATLAPYLVGIVVQFAFDQYARFRKSPAWPIIPIIFQVYRLHQLNRAAQLVTALSFTVRGAEMTAHNIEISNSLGTLLNVLQLLGVICIWSLSSFLMKFFPSHPKTA